MCMHHLCTGQYDKAIPDHIQPAMGGECGHEWPFHTRYLWKDYLQDERLQIFPVDRLRNTWVHHIGDSIDRYMFELTLKYVLDAELKELGSVLPMRYLNPQNADPAKRFVHVLTVYHWPTANVTISYNAMTSAVHIKGYQMFDDTDTNAAPEYPGKVVSVAVGL
ncbi:hypothetical protein SARC_09372 [Sphaeroforma arctica JP610]|uniref:Uncharacterized protein n=1 Tax=Sphaeroforma arctica JP610 TaxID=667725 RepID=A0A0L0FN82_9EUKA|nr:hypothetical protein SARC_09372 [Sphaeroforma arctica JP610]KNC78189.1 hypothetical protein SARC_09372 [Sphaeroforma arctica JP610]|eukprot:XP_014152091.1 hypothetical protein SARC_09372 [Sphaeroforma arctica JP610]